MQDKPTTDRDEIRHGEQIDAAPPERFGNEEDAHSREYRRAYSEQHLERRLHDDRPYERPGYEPEAGRPGQRENVDLDQASMDQDAAQGDTPYAEGEVSPWYGGDTGMGEPGTSLDQDATTKQPSQGAGSR